MKGRVLMYHYLRIIILMAVLGVPHPVREARASALAAPPSAMRFVIFNAVDGTNLTSTAVTVNLAALGQPFGSTTRSILIGNDAAADATGNSDLLVDTSGATAATPANGVGGSTTTRIFPGKEYNFDGQYTTLSMKARVTSIPVHLMITY